VCSLAGITLALILESNQNIKLPNNFFQTKVKFQTASKFFPNQSQIPNCLKIFSKPKSNSKLPQIFFQTKVKLQNAKKFFPNQSQTPKCQKNFFQTKERFQRDKFSKKIISDYQFTNFQNDLKQDVKIIYGSKILKKSSEINHSPKKSS
jgi:hypothetical protein